MTTVRPSLSNTHTNKFHHRRVLPDRKSVFDRDCTKYPNL